MQTDTYHAIGLMSGTSLDGLDIAYCQFTKQGDSWESTILECETVAYPEQLKDSLKFIMQFSAEDLTYTDLNLGHWMGEQVRVFKNKYLIRPDFIASHGHTVFHQPQNGMTLQIGDLSAIHSKTDLPVIGDFRKLDVLKGGQGAPLVPIGDRLLFSEYDVCVNLGGIANLSVEKNDGKRIAYDICPCNLLLNKLAASAGLSYDKNGEMAAKGTINEDLNSDFNKFSFYQQDPPKSLGLEQIQEIFYPLIEDSTDSIADLLATSVEHIAEKISQEIKSQIKEGSILFTGGGAHNHFLMKKIKEKLGRDIKVAEVSKNLVDYKEALIFAFLGVLNVRNEINVLCSVTGAESDSVSGIRIGNFSI